jgi:hypothetical protein
MVLSRSEANIGNGERKIATKGQEILPAMAKEDPSVKPYSELRYHETLILRSSSPVLLRIASIAILIRGD